MTYNLAVKHNNLLLYLPSQGYMFRLLRVIIRPSTELIQVYLTTSALLDPVVLTVCAKTGVHVNQTYFGSVQWRAWWWIEGVETCSPVTLDIVINCCVWLPKYMSYFVIRNTSGCLALTVQYVCKLLWDHLVVFLVGSTHEQKSLHMHLYDIGIIKTCHQH
jgi:hypothetical protein